MKIPFVALTLVLSVAAYAGPAEDALLSAQSAYRTALKAQTDNDSKLITLQSNLADAQKRAQQAQQDIERLQGEIQAAAAVKTEQAGVLQQAGQALDAAWNAVYGPGGTQAAR